jgi:hypothetical protein
VVQHSGEQLRAYRPTRYSLANNTSLNKRRRISLSLKSRLCLWRSKGFAFATFTHATIPVFARRNPSYRASFGDQERYSGIQANCSTPISLYMPALHTYIYCGGGSALRTRRRGSPSKFVWSFCTREKVRCYYTWSTSGGALWCTQRAWAHVFPGAYLSLFRQRLRWLWTYVSQIWHGFSSLK